MLLMCDEGDGTFVCFAMESSVALPRVEGFWQLLFRRAFTRTRCRGTCLSTFLTSKR